MFSNSRAKINKGSKTSYADWCKRYGFQCADKLVPDEWKAEAPNEASLAAIKAIRENV